MRQLKISKQITNRESPALEKYLQEIAKIDLLTPDEEVELAIKVKEGDQVALERLTKANLRFVISVSKQYQNQGLSLSDLINEGNVGLIKAAQRFDETRGFKFISYAVWWIRQSILQALAEQSRMVRLPLNKIGSLSKLNKTFTKLEQEFEREPSTEELAMKLDLKPSEVSTLLKGGARHQSVDAPVSSDADSVTLIDVLVTENEKNNPDNELLQDSLSTEIERALSVLPTRDAEIVAAFYGLNKETCSLEEIGNKYDLTRERVRQIKERAIRRLRRASTSKGLKPYLGN